MKFLRNENILPPNAQKGTVPSLKAKLGPLNDNLYSNLFVNCGLSTEGSVKADVRRIEEKIVRID